MAIRLEQFVKDLENSGILAGDTIRDFLPPKTKIDDVEDLAKELVRQKKLTKYQAEELYRGKGKALVIGNYTLLEKIGAGGMGQVFKAEHRHMKRIVAVKMLPPAMLKNADVVARFSREAMTAARLNHPNIVTAFDADKVDGRHLLVMEYVEGSNLSDFVKRNGPLPVARAVDYILQTARGLEAAHAETIVHRDIKPANLLLDKNGTVKILNMGLARIGGLAPGQAELTGTGAILGTVDYMAPEQAVNTKTADARADIYSLGCTLFYLLTGKPMFPADSIMAKLIAHREEPVPSLRAQRPEVPEQLDAVFAKMVAKQIDERYQAMTDVIADLQRTGRGPAAAAVTQPAAAAFSDSGLSDFLQDMALEAPKSAPSRTLKRPDTWLRDNKKHLTIGASSLAAVLLIAGLAFGLRTKTRSPEKPEKTANGQPRNGELRNTESISMGAEPAPKKKSAPANEPVKKTGKEIAAKETSQSVPTPRTGGDLQRLQGEWVTIYEECNGEVFDPPKVKEIDRHFTFRGSALHVTRKFDDQLWQYEGRFVLAGKAGEFDWKGTGPDGQSLQWKGIYQLSGDRLKVCFNYVENSRTDRPAGFSTSNRSEGTCFNLVLKRR